MSRLIIKVWNFIKSSPPAFKVVGGVIAALASLITIATPIISHLSSHTWVTEFQDSAPWCANDSGHKPSWMIPDKSSTSLLCSSLDELEIVPSAHASLAEFDLDRIDGQSYQQNELDVKVTVNFGDKQDSNTMAGLAVQVPQLGTGGYGLVINNTGYWEFVNNKQRVASGTIATHQTIYRLELKVDGGKLYGWINGGEPVWTADDTSNTSNSVIGLIIFNRFQKSDGSYASLAPVCFTNFALSL